MTATLADVAQAYAGALADLFDSQANWREDKLAQFPDDQRNRRCADALTAAAEYVRGIEQPLDLRGIGWFVAFHAELDDWPGAPLTPLGVAAEGGILSSSGREAGRFFFDNGSRGPTPGDFDLLVEWTFAEVLEEYRELIAGGINDQPPGSLVAFFEQQGVSLWEEDEE